MMRKLMGFGLAAACGLMGVRQAGASVMFRYVADQPSYTASAAGATMQVNLYLQEVDSGSTAASVLSNATNGGLASYAVTVTRQTAGLPATPATITGATVDATDFGGPPGTTVNPDSAILDGTVAPTATTGVAPGNGSGALANEVFLGSITMTAGGAGGKTTFVVGPKGTTGTNTLDNALDDLDISGTATNGTPYIGAVSATPFAFSITTAGGTTPEPASLGLLAIGAAGLLARRRK